MSDCKTDGWKYEDKYKEFVRELELERAELERQRAAMDEREANLSYLAANLYYERELLIESKKGRLNGKPF